MKRRAARHFDRLQIEVIVMKTAPLLLCLLGLAACSGKPPTPQSDPTAAASTPAPWDAMKQDEQRAKDVQKLVNKQAADQDKQVEQQSQ
jgi:ABC-type glycerol-3-phosphate transport system substrate-binding protein